MNLYLISQDINDEWDAYSSAVVAAETEEEARLIHPGGDRDFYCDHEDGINLGFWANSPTDVKVEFLGIAKLNTKTGVILALGG